MTRAWPLVRAATAPSSITPLTVVTNSSGARIAEAFENLTNGPSYMAGDMMRAAEQFMAALTRNQAVEVFAQAQAAAMGPQGHAERA